MSDSIVRNYLDQYEFVHDGISRPLTDDERALLEDFGEGLLASILADPDPEAVGARLDAAQDMLANVGRYDEDGNER
jgi:hypothetical protein